MRPLLRDYVLNAAPVGAPRSRLRPDVTPGSNDDSRIWIFNAVDSLLQHLCLSPSHQLAPNEDFRFAPISQSPVQSRFEPRSEQLTPHPRLRPMPPRQLTLEPAGATRVNTSRRGTPSVRRAMGCDAQSRSACTRQDRLRLRQRTHFPNRIMISSNPKTDQTDGLRVTHGLRSTLGLCSGRAAFGVYGCV